MSSPDDSNISRSGRIRKKSSKLADFQSPEEIAEAARQRRLSKKDENLSGSIFDPVESDSDGGDLSATSIDADLDMDIDQFDLKLEDIENLPDIDDDELIDVSARTEIVKKPVNLPALEDKPNSHKVTPFLLWAKHAKPEIVKQNPGLGPSHLRVKLGELWNTVPKSEKLGWSKKAKRLQVRSGGSNQKAVFAAPNSPAVKSPILSPSLESRLVPGTHRVGDLEPVNIASHLKLLGESLSVIGERLTEHEGQIAVSGSLSVLLDSLLCALGPLIGLTQRVPELNGADPRVLSQTLDNVAYIMPGL
eukprot:TRINITY_DN7530_c0_g2_i1.p1 TRINITY_DN7530_c0_g2~~TRINITY_DN7530_c0_g2_i1.p1  ORF type:complete len:305 (-),score=33.26 TRINITY_DN7530_c0_g2_i1:141-1055(-)